MNLQKRSADDFLVLLNLLRCCGLSISLALQKFPYFIFYFLFTINSAEIWFFWLSSVFPDVGSGYKFYEEIVSRDFCCYLEHSPRLKYSVHNYWLLCPIFLDRGVGVADSAVFFRASVCSAGVK